MKSLTRGHLKAGFDSVRRAKMRNFWTMLGIIIGVASVITIVSIGEGVKVQIAQQVSKSGKNLITIRPGTVNINDGQNQNFNVLAGLSITGSLRPQDADIVTKSKLVTASAPLAAISTKVVSEPAGQFRNGVVIGTTPDFPTLVNQSLAYGVFLAPDDMGMNVAVIGEDAADKMFDVDVPLGHAFTIGGEEFIVRGILEDFNNTPLSDRANYNSAIFIPYDVAQKLTKDNAVVYEILAKTANENDIQPAIADIEKNLQASHGGRLDVVFVGGLS